MILNETVVLKNDLRILSETGTLVCQSDVATNRRVLVIWYSEEKEATQVIKGIN